MSTPVVSPISSNSCPARKTEQRRPSARCPFRGLITRRSQVRILAPQSEKPEASPVLTGGGFVLQTSRSVNRDRIGTRRCLRCLNLLGPLPGGDVVALEHCRGPVAGEAGHHRWRRSRGTAWGRSPQPRVPRDVQGFQHLRGPPRRPSQRSRPARPRLRASSRSVPVWNDGQAQAQEVGFGSAPRDRSSWSSPGWTSSWEGEAAQGTSGCPSVRRVPGRGRRPVAGVAGPVPGVCAFESWNARQALVRGGARGGARLDV